jgi:hypothetical protein
MYFNSLGCMIGGPHSNPFGSASHHNNREDLAMVESVISFVLIASVVIVPFAWRMLVDRRREEALALQARLQRTANQRLGGESYLVVAVQPAIFGRGGRVLLAAPERWCSLVDQVWKDVRAATPPDYDLVVPSEAHERAVVPLRAISGRPA